MKYSFESLKKFSEKMKVAIETFRNENMDNLHVSISTGNKKIGKVLNVSLPPVFTCANCSGCMEYCYDIKACFAYPSCMQARAKNMVIMQKDLNKYMDEIRNKLMHRRTNKFFRWHVAGDIPSMEYFKHMIAIAKDFPEFKFWTYTKNYSLVNKYCDENGGMDAIPENLSIMFSEWKGMPMVNPYGFPEFSVVFPEDENKPDPKTNHYCPGNCDICKERKTGCPYRQTTYCKAH